MSKLKSYALAAVLAAVYGIVAQIAVPFPPVPLTFQCFAIALGGYVMGWRIGLVSTVLYISIGAVGLPVFTGSRGGVDVLLGPTGGFVWGFLLLMLLCGFGKDKKRLTAFLLGVSGLVLCNALGWIQFVALGNDGVKAFVATTLPYVLKDALLLWAAASISPSISTAISNKR